MKKRKAPFKFVDFSQKQKMVLEWWTPASPYCNKDGIICDGSIRAGKTTVMSLSFIIWAMDNFEEENFALCGKTINALRRNVIKQLKRIIVSRGYRYKEHRVENYITIYYEGVENDFYLFGGKDESSQDLIQGITLAGVFFDEVALMPESFVNQAVGRCSVEGSKFWFNCNPDRPSHWFKEGWIDNLSDKDMIRIHFEMEDNPSLSSDMIRRYKSLFTGVFYDRFIRGLWVMAEGLIFPMYQEAMIKSVPEGEIEKTIFSVDYGTMNAFAMIQWNKYENDKTWYAVNGYYYSGRSEGIQKTDIEYMQEISEKFSDVISEYRNKKIDAKEFDLMPPEKLAVIIDPSASSFIALLKKQDWCKTRKAKNEVLNGIRDTAVALQTGLIKIVDNSSLQQWKKEAGGYVWDDTELEDRPIKINDHYIDATRYFVRTMKLVKFNREVD